MEVLYEARREKGVRTVLLILNLNPSLDKIYELEKLPHGKVSRARSVLATAGGKATHVAHVLSLLGEACTMIGFQGGTVGRFIEDSVSGWGVRTAFTSIVGTTRSCLNLRTSDGAETEVLESGPAIRPEEREDFMAKYQTLLPKATLIAASGSLPRGLSVGFYGELAKMAKQAGKPFLLDTSGETLLSALESKPYFIKPNRDEAEAIFGKPLREEKEVAEAVGSLMKQGVALPVITLGSEGAVVGWEGRIYRVTPPAPREVLNCVGSGDSFVAGIAAGIARSMPIEGALKLAAACGTANVVEKESGYISAEYVASLEKRVCIAKIA